MAYHDRSHITAATNPGLIDLVGAMLCREPAVCDIIAADALSARPRRHVRAKKKKSCCLDPCLARISLQEGNLLILSCDLHCVLSRGPLLSRPRPQGIDVVCCGSGRLLSGCLSSTKSVGLFERSRSTGCISPASAKCLAPEARWRRTGERENETVGARQG